jgi:hypothetical protein
LSLIPAMMIHGNLVGCQDALGEETVAPLPSFLTALGHGQLPQVVEQTLAKKVLSSDIFPNPALKKN